MKILASLAAIALTASVLTTYSAIAAPKCKSGTHWCGDTQKCVPN